MKIDGLVEKHLEGLNKEYNTNIIISESVEQKVKDIYFKYALEHQWPIIEINPSRTKEDIHEEVWDIVRLHIL